MIAGPVKPLFHPIGLRMPQGTITLHTGNFMDCGSELVPKSSAFEPYRQRYSYVSYSVFLQNNLALV